jgi:hypothetical protein
MFSIHLWFQQSTKETAEGSGACLSKRSKLITIPLGAKHGKSFTIAISNAPAKSEVLITLSDRRTKLARTSGAGAASISIPAPKIGLLLVTPSFGGVNLKSSTVLVSQRFQECQSTELKTWRQTGDIVLFFGALRGIRLAMLGKLFPH